MPEKFTIYSFVGSQWAGVAHLALAEKGFTLDDYNLKEVDLATAENFDPEYLKINPNGTVPSLTSPSLSKPLTESMDILRYLDTLHSESTLVPLDAEVSRNAQAIIDLVHSSHLDTNLILFQARDAAEMKRRRESMWNEFLANRQHRLEKEKQAHPDHSFYGPKAQENSVVHALYQNETGAQHNSFFEATHAQYKMFAEGMEKLEGLFVLPFAADDRLTEADFHAIPWLAHAMWGAGTDAYNLQEFSTLEALIQKSVPGFVVGPKTKQWWANVAKTKAFAAVFPKLH